MTFGNGVKHGYNTSAGHGMLDVYAQDFNQLKLKPYSRSSYVIDGSGQTVALSADASLLRSSSSFGNALQLGLSNVENYFYDALGGGFKYKLSGHVLNEDNKKIEVNIDFTILDKNKINKHNQKLEFANDIKKI